MLDALEGDADAAAAIVAARNLIEAGHAECFEGPVVDLNDSGFRKYLVGELHSPREERMLAIFLDQSGAYLGQERYSSAGSASLSLCSRNLVHRMLDIGARALILAHNHPSGSATASAKDHTSTQRLREIIEPLEIQLVDHLIVARGCVFSMQRGELL